MMRKVRVEEQGDTDLLPGSMVDVFEFEDANEAGAKKAAEEGREFEPATYTPVLLGITKASLATDSFLSAASFQETTRVLHRSCHQGQDRPADGPERKRHHWQTGARRQRYGPLQQGKL